MKVTQGSESEPQGRTIECPACGTEVSVSAADVVAEHSNRNDNPCVASGWTIKESGTR